MPFTSQVYVGLGAVRAERGREDKALDLAQPLKQAAHHLMHITSSHSSMPLPTYTTTGETCAIEAAGQRCTLGPESSAGQPVDELFSQVFWPAPHFVLISTAGVVELEKRRWVRHNPCKSRHDACGSALGY